MTSDHAKQTKKSKPDQHHQIRNLILGISEELSEKNSYNDHSTCELYAETGINKKTDYETIANNAELIDSIVSNQIAIKEKELEERIRLAKNPIQEAFIAWHIIHEFVQHYNINTLVQIKKSFIQTFEKIIAFKNEFIFQLFKSNVDRGIEAGLYRETVKSEIISQYLADISFMSPNSKVFSLAGFSSMEIDIQLLTHQE